MIYLSLTVIMLMIEGRYTLETNRNNITNSESETYVIKHINEFLDDIQSDIRKTQNLLQSYRNNMLTNHDLTQYILQNNQIPTLLTAFTYLVERIALKNEYDTKHIFVNTEGMFYEANKDHKFAGQPVDTKVINILRRIITMTHESGVKHRAMILHFMLTHKNEIINNELLDIVTFIESFVKTSDIINIYKVIDQYITFPLDDTETAITAKELCYDIIKSLFAPITKLADHTYNLSKLIDSISHFLKKILGQKSETVG